MHPAIARIIRMLRLTRSTNIDILNFTALNICPPPKKKKKEKKKKKNLKKKNKNNKRNNKA